MQTVTEALASRMSADSSRHAGGCLCGEVRCVITGQRGFLSNSTLGSISILFRSSRGDAREETHETD
jgi:hypothetical protein